MTLKAAGIQPQELVPGMSATPCVMIPVIIYFLHQLMSDFVDVLFPVNFPINTLDGHERSLQVHPVQGAEQLSTSDSTDQEPHGRQ